MFFFKQRISSILNGILAILLTLYINLQCLNFFLLYKKSDKVKGYLFIILIWNFEWTRKGVNEHR